MTCDRCSKTIANGQFYIEARRREGKPFIPPRPGVDNGLNLDPYVFLHIPAYDVYA